MIVIHGEMLRAAVILKSDGAFAPPEAAGECGLGSVNPQKLQQWQLFFFAPAIKAPRKIRIDEQGLASRLGMGAMTGWMTSFSASSLGFTVMDMPLPSLMRWTDRPRQGWCGSYSG